MIQDILTQTWNKLVEDINKDIIKASSEKSLVFHFAWRLKEQLSNKVENIDFEKQLFDKFSDGTFLDLYFEYKNKKIGIEFKYPRSSQNGYSNSTQTRIKIVNDLKRLSYLVNIGKIDVGVFFMLANEKTYIFEGRKKDNLEFKTYNNCMYLKDQILPTHPTESKEHVISPIEIEFIWNGLKDNELYENYASLKPIYIYK